MNLIYKLIKFGLTGFVGMCLDFGLTFLLKEKWRVNKYVANACGFTTAVVNNFLLNKFWTFQSASRLWEAELVKFALIAVVGLALSTILVYFFTEKMGIKFYVSKAISIVIVFCWNFTLNFLFNFH